MPRWQLALALLYGYSGWSMRRRTLTVNDFPLTSPNLGCIFPPSQTEFIAGQVS